MIFSLLRPNLLAEKKKKKNLIYLKIQKCENVNMEH